MHKRATRRGEARPCAGGDGDGAGGEPFHRGGWRGRTGKEPEVFFFQNFIGFLNNNLIHIGVELFRMGYVDEHCWSHAPIIGRLTTPSFWPRGRRPGVGPAGTGRSIHTNLVQVDEIPRLPLFTPLHSLLRRALTDNFLRTPHLAQDLHTVEPPASISTAARDADDGSDDLDNFWRRFLDSAE
jgi:hypothetical protein